MNTPLDKLWHQKIAQTFDKGYKEKKHIILDDNNNLFLMGSEDLNDVILDLQLPFNNIEYSKRYKEIQQFYNKNKKNISRIYAHSLASHLITTINNDNKYMQEHTKIYSYNNPISPLTPMKPNQKDYTNNFDVISIFDPYAKRYKGTWNPYKAHFTYEKH